MFLTKEKQAVVSVRIIINIFLIIFILYQAKFHAPIQNWFGVVFY